MCGTPSHLAPEVVNQESEEGYDNRVNSWSVGAIVFAMFVFYSTISHAFQFSCRRQGKSLSLPPPRLEDFSLRILSEESFLIQPFTDVGFDTLACKISLGKGWKLDKLASNFHMAHLGRPLYVLFSPLIYFLADTRIHKICITIRCW